MSSVPERPLDRSALQRKERKELTAIAEALGVRPSERASKSTLIDLILRETGLEGGTNQRLTPSAPPSTVPPLERTVLERKEREELATIAAAMGVKTSNRASKSTLVDLILREMGLESGGDQRPAPPSAMPPLERSLLERKERDQLATIAEAMGVKPSARASKSTLIDAVLREAGIETAPTKRPSRSRTPSAENPLDRTLLERKERKELVAIAEAMGVRPAASASKLTIIDAIMREAAPVDGPSTPVVLDDEPPEVRASVPPEWDDVGTLAFIRRGDMLPAVEAWMDQLDERAAELAALFSITLARPGHLGLSLIAARYGDCVADYFIEVLGRQPSRFEEVARFIDQNPSIVRRYTAELTIRIAERAASYVKARTELALLQSVEPRAAALLTQEFGYLLSTSEEDLQRTGSPARSIPEALTLLRKALAPSGDTPMRARPGATRHPLQQAGGQRPSDDVPDTDKSPKGSPLQKGNTLEAATLRLLEQLFVLDDGTAQGLLRVLRRQRSGAQYGNDIQFEARVVGTVSSICRVECKNLSTPLALKDVADKLLQQERAARERPIDHWILVSPHQDPTNELNEMVGYWEQQRRFPFRVHIWSPQNGIRDLFATVPEIYSALYGQDPTEHSSAILSRYREDLQPLVRLEPAFVPYLVKPDLMAFPQEPRTHFVDLLQDHVELNVLDAAGRPTATSLYEHVRHWLSDRGPSTYLLLAEFGEGKSYFTYVLGRRLAAEFLSDPRNSWFPLRMPLRELRRAASPEAFIRHQVERIGATVDGWARLSAHYPVVYMFDGFDEMSPELDPETVSQNLRRMWELWDYVGAGSTDLRCRVLVTSRGRFFDEPKEETALRSRLGQPLIGRIRPLSRTAVVENLTAYARRIGAEDKLARVCSLYDPIGLASKPLFLAMIKETLEELPDDRFGPTELYHEYVRTSLERKRELLLSGSTYEDSDAVIASMRRILGQVAVALQDGGCEYVDLRVIEEGSNRESAELLWKMASVDQEPTSRTIKTQAQGTADARMRVSIRSLLRPVPSDDPEAWPVTFFHRSLTEYFLAVALSEALTGDLVAPIRDILAKRQLPPETVQFLVPLVGQSEMRAVTQRLISLARGAAVGLAGEAALGGNALSLAFALNHKFPEWPREWEGLNLDYLSVPGADLRGRSFRNSSLRFANLDNCDLRDADLRNADLSGMRIERTSEVDAITVDSDRAAVLAAYSDGIIREWRPTPDGRWTAVTVFEGLACRARNIDLLTPSLAIVAATTEAWVFGRSTERWSVISRIPVSPFVRSISVGDDGNVVIFSTCRMAEIVEGSLSKASISRTRIDGLLPEHLDGSEADIQQFSATPPRSVDRGRWILAGSPRDPSEEFVLYDALEGSQWVLSGWSAPPTAIEVKLGDEARPAIVLVGCADGTLWSTGSMPAPGNSVRLLRLASSGHHDGAITTIRTMDRTVLTGGVDRCIRVWKNALAGDSNEPEITALFLTPRCHGAQLAGVKGNRERYLLSSIQGSDSR